MSYTSLKPTNKLVDPPGDITTWSSFSSTATREDVQEIMKAEPGDDKIGNFIFRKSSLTQVGNPLYEYVFVFTIKVANIKSNNNFIHRLFIRNMQQKYMHVDANFQPATDVGNASNVWYDSIYKAIYDYVESLSIGPNMITADEKEVLLQRFMKE